MTDRVLAVGIGCRKSSAARVYDPDVRNSHTNVVGDLLLEFPTALVGREDFDAEDGRGVWYGLERVAPRQKRNVWDAVTPGGDSDSQLGTRTELEFALMQAKVDGKEHL